MKLMKVLFVLPRMWAGGVERVTLNLAAAFKQQGIECCLALRCPQGELIDEAQHVFSGVEVIAAEGMQHFVPRLTTLLRTLQPTHIVTAFTDIGLLTLIAKRRSRVDARLIHGIHTTHAFANRRPGFPGLLRYGLDRIFARTLYPRVDAIVCVSRGIEMEVRHCCPFVADKVRTIYNPVASETEISNYASQEHRHPGLGQAAYRFVALGRLTPQKGFDVLIRAAANLPAQPDWRLDIYGDGPQRDVLQALINKHELGGRVILHGHTDRPHAALEAADALVLSSRYEGFGLVIIEAMMHGVQIIATDCPHGPREILEDGRLGQLVPSDNPAALAQAMQQIMAQSNPVDPTALKNRAAQFSTEASAAQWLDVLNQA